VTPRRAILVIVIGAVLAALIVGGSIWTIAASTRSGSFDVPLIHERGPSADGDDSSGANDEADENEPDDSTQETRSKDDSSSGDRDEPNENESNENESEADAG
jgi:FtsZ-interacting cell division protein ZipA